MKAQWQHNILTTDFSRTGCPPYLWSNFEAILGRGHVFLLAIILLKNSRSTNSPRVKGELNFRCHTVTFKSFFFIIVLYPQSSRVLGDISWNFVGGFGEGAGESPASPF